MAKKTVSKTASKNFLVLDEDLQASCCGERFATAALATAEAARHVDEDVSNGYTNNEYYVVQLISKVAAPTVVQAVVTTL